MLGLYSILILFLMASTVAQNPMMDEPGEATCDTELLTTDGSVYFKGKPVSLVLTESALTVYSSKDRTQGLIINTADLIGSTLEEGKERLMSTVHIVYYPAQHGFFVNEKGGTVRARRVASLRFGDSRAAALNWVNAVRSVAANAPLRFAEEGGVGGVQGEEGVEGVQGAEGSVSVTVLPPPVRSFLVVVNPVGGRKQAMGIWKKKVQPMLMEAGVVFTLVVTEYANHAKKVAAELDANLYNAIVCIGGDGIVFEVVNGLISREDGKEVLVSLPIAHVPGGTGNGLGKSVMFASGEACSPVNAVFIALRGHSSPLDLSRYTTKSGVQHMSFLSFAWGLVADVDILSESMRYLGEARLHIAAVYFLTKKKYYTGVLRLKITENDGETCDNNELIAAAAAFPDGDSVGFGKQAMAQARIMGDEGSYAAAQALLDGIQLRIEPSFEGSSDGWVTVEGNFLMVWAVQTSHASTSIYSGPGVTLDDGFFTIYVVHRMSRWGILKLLLEMDAGGHVNHPQVKVYKCSAFSLEPITERGIYSLDGEVVEYGHIEAEILPSAARVLSL
jgi:sphingosine kinase